MSNQNFSNEASKGISTPIGILIIVLTVFLAGGIMAWQHQQYKSLEVEVIEVKTLKKEVKDETADWKTYRNEEYGFEVKYPSNLRLGKIYYNSDVAPIYFGNDDLFIVGFDYGCPVKNGSLIYVLSVRVALNSSQISLDEWIMKDNSLMWDDISRQELEDFYLSGIKGLKLKKARVSYYVAHTILYVDAVYLSKDSKVYMLTSARMDKSSFSEEEIKNCSEQQKNIFNQMLSTFRFFE